MAERLATIPYVDSKLSSTIPVGSTMYSVNGTNVFDETYVKNNGQLLDTQSYPDFPACNMVISDLTDSSTTQGFVGYQNIDSGILAFDINRNVYFSSDNCKTFQKTGSIPLLNTYVSGGWANTDALFVKNNIIFCIYTSTCKWSSDKGATWKTINIDSGIDTIEYLNGTYCFINSNYEYATLYYTTNLNNSSLSISEVNLTEPNTGEYMGLILGIATTKNYFYAITAVNGSYSEQAYLLKSANGINWEIVGPIQNLTLHGDNLGVKMVSINSNDKIILHDYRNSKSYGVYLDVNTLNMDSSINLAANKIDFSHMTISYLKNLGAVGIFSKYVSSSYGQNCIIPLNPQSWSTDTSSGIVVAKTDSSVYFERPGFAAELDDGKIIVGYITGSYTYYGHTRTGKIFNKLDKNNGFTKILK